MDQHINELAAHFQRDPLQFFHEHEIHSEFYRLTRTAYGMATTTDGHAVYLLRHEYNTLWRYHGKGKAPFEIRSANTGDVGEIDFVKLRKDFVESHRYLAVMNKEESIRHDLRTIPLKADQSSPIIEYGIEFKMAHVHPVGSPKDKSHGVHESHFNWEGIVADCRKLASEHVGIGYVLAFLHQPTGSWLTEQYAIGLFDKCVKAWNASYGTPQTAVQRLKLLIVSPQECFRWGTWENPYRNSIAVTLG